MTTIKNSIVPRLAFSLGRRDEAPNIDLANELATTQNAQAIDELVEIARTAKKRLRYNAIKTLYEMGKIQPNLLRPLAQDFINLLDDKDNRILWGSIQALDVIADKDPEFIAKNLNRIIDAADRSSVVAKDRVMSILSKLNAHPNFCETITPVILMRLLHCAPNQFPMYAQYAAATLPGADNSKLSEIIKQRQKSIASPAKQKRLNKILQSL